MLMYRAITKKVFWEWFYYYANPQRHFAIVLLINMAVLSRKWKPRIRGLENGKSYQVWSLLDTGYIMYFNRLFLIHKAQVAVNTTTNAKKQKQKTKQKWALTDEGWPLIPVKRSNDRRSVAGNFNKMDSWWNYARKRLRALSKFPTKLRIEKVEQPN